MSNFKIVCPAMRGVQAHREFYSLMLPVQALATLFTDTIANSVEVVNEHATQRVLNYTRVNKICEYILCNDEDFVIPAVTIAAEGITTFKTAFEDNPLKSSIGTIDVDLDATFQILDGQHRIAAILRAMKDQRGSFLKYQHVPVTLYVSKGKQHSQQIFTDINMNAVKTAKSINIAFDHRDELANLTREIITNNVILRDLTEWGKSAISGKSIKLFTISSIYQSTGRFLSSKGNFSSAQKNLAHEYWFKLTEAFEIWEQARTRIVLPSELRENFVHAHGIALMAITEVAIDLYNLGRFDELKQVAQLDWSRTNKMWQGRAVVMGKIKRNTQSIVLTSNQIKKALGIELNPVDLSIERNFLEES